MKEQIVATLRKEIQLKGYTYRELSELMGGVSLGAIHNALNKNNPTLKTLIKMCEVLGLELVVVKK